MSSERLLKNIRALQAYNGFSRAKMLEILGMSDGTFSRRCNNQNTFTVGELAKFAKAAGVPITELFK